MNSSSALGVFCKDSGYKPKVNYTTEYRIDQTQNKHSWNAKMLSNPRYVAASFPQIQPPQLKSYKLTLYTLVPSY